MKSTFAGITLAVCLATRFLSGDETPQRRANDVKNAERTDKIGRAVQTLSDPKSRDDDEAFVAAIDELARERAWEAVQSLASAATFRSYLYESDPRVPPRIRGNPTFALKYPATAALNGFGSIALPGIVDAIAASEKANPEMQENLRITVLHIVGNESQAYELLLRVAPANLSPEKRERVQAFANAVSPNRVQVVKEMKDNSSAIRKNLTLTGREKLDSERILLAIRRAKEGRVAAVLPELVEKLEYESPDAQDPLEERYPAIGTIIEIGPGALLPLIKGVAVKGRSPTFLSNAAYCVSKIVGSADLDRCKDACEFLLTRMASHFPKEEAARILAFSKDIPEVKYVRPEREEPTPADLNKP